MTGAPKWGVAEKELLVALNPERTQPFFFVTLYGEIPSSAKRYATRAAAQRAADRRNREDAPRDAENARLAAEARRAMESAR